MNRSALGRFRMIGLLEAISFVALVFVAMPLKYFADTPEAVRVVGLIHGVLFILYCLSLLPAKKECGWTMSRTAVLFVAALLPFGPFVTDRRLGEEQRELEAATG